MKLKEGDTVALVSCPSYRVVDLDAPADTEPTLLSGLWSLMEFWPYEPSAYHWDSGWVLYREGLDEDETYFVDAMTMWEQTDPHGFAHYLESEREMEDMLNRQEAGIY